MTATILTCIDGSVYSASVADHAAWAARRLGASVQLLKVLGRRDASSADRSGRIVAGARRQLLEQLATLDAERAKLLREEARLELEEVAAHLARAGVEDVTTLLRHGDLLETMQVIEETAALTVIGKRGEAADFAKLHLGSNLERILRAAQRPVLVASRAFKPITRCVVAFDGGTTVQRAVDTMSRSPLFRDLPVLLVMAAEETAERRRKIEAAAAQLAAGGLSVESGIVAGPPDSVIPEALNPDGGDILMMGAYGHSRLRTLVIGSTTAEMIRAARVPILVYR
ncbi:MAG: universal stress protein [Pseudomonadota bacterium]